VTSELLTRLTTVDYERRLALVAADMSTGQELPWPAINGSTTTSAEVAVVVDPGWRRAGVATALIKMLAEAALDRGHPFFTATYLAENRPVAALRGAAGRRHADYQAGFASSSCG
jgi:GNAT superfamily N-acetyltransferase